jgi:uncharacterized protein YbjT (DUF2867 family)
MTVIAVAGATGTIGRPLVELLAVDPAKVVRAATRTPSSTAFDRAVTTVDFDWQRPDGADELLADAELLVVIPPAGQHPLATVEILLDRARAHGAQHVVLVSTLGADFTPGFAFGRWALESEHALRAAGLSWTVVRPNSYMSNFAGMLRPGPDGALRMPWADGATSFVDPADVAAAMAAVLGSPADHRGIVYELTGPAALTCANIAEILSAAGGEPIRYIAMPPGEVRARMIAGGAPPPFVDALMELHAVMAGRDRARVTDHLARLTGRPPRSLSQWAEAHPRIRQASRMSSLSRSASTASRRSITSGQPS